MSRTCRGCNPARSACVRAGNWLSRERWASYALPSDQRLDCGGDAGHQLRRCFQVPVGMGDVRVTQVGRQSDEVTRDRFAPRRALLQCSCRERVAKVMNARWACPSGGNPGNPTYPAEGVLHRAGGNSLISCRQKHMIVGDGQLAALFEVAVKDMLHRGMQGNQAALTR